MHSYQRKGWQLSSVGLDDCLQQQHCTMVCTVNSLHLRLSLPDGRGKVISKQWNGSVFPVNTWRPPDTLTLALIHFTADHACSLFLKLYAMYCLASPYNMQPDIHASNMQVILLSWKLLRGKTSGGSDCSPLTLERCRSRISISTPQTAPVASTFPSPMPSQTSLSFLWKRVRR